MKKGQTDQAAQRPAAAATQHESCRTLHPEQAYGYTTLLRCKLYFDLKTVTR